MADDKPDQEHEAATAPAKKGGSMKLIIIIVAAALVLGVGGFFGFKMMSGKGKESAAEHGDKKEGEHGAAAVLIPMDPFVVNLSERGKYLKLSIQLEVADKAAEELVKAKTPNIRDTVITLLSSKSTEAVSGPEGKIQLKDELLLRVNQAIGKETVKNLYYTDFVMQ